MPSEPRIESLPTGAVVTLSGELDLYDAPALRASFEQVAASRPRLVVLDLAAVSFLDSTVLGALVGLLRRVREHRGQLRVVLPETTARRIFEVTGVVEALDVWPSREEAVSAPPAAGY